MCCEAQELLGKIPSESVDLILTDPPYGISYYSNHGTEEYKARVMQTGWDDDFHFGEYLDECFRVLKDNSYMLVFGCEENIALMKHLGSTQTLVWDKGHCGMGNVSDFGIGYELIFVFKKGKPALRGKRVNGVLPFEFHGSFDKTVHPTAKPVSLLRFLITKTSDVGGVVLDPFAGSGSTLIAAKQSGRVFIGCESNAEYVRIIQERLAQKSLSEVL